jgi:HEPN domain-containing protein
MPPDPRQDAKAWLAKAEEDLFAAQELLRLGDDAPLAIVCFHAQQSVEKCLKARLVAASIDFPRTHDVVLLARRVPELSERTASIEALLDLNRYAVEARYPGE